MIKILYDYHTNDVKSVKLIVDVRDKTMKITNFLIGVKN